MASVIACERNLEDELIRVLGPDGVLVVIASHGEIQSFRKLQRKPAQMDRELMDHLRRFLHGRSGNKARYNPRSTFEHALRL